VCSQMLTGSGALMIVSPQEVLPSSFDLIWCHGVLRSNQRYLTLVLKQNIRQRLMLR
jgi:hypothetical protein